MRHDGRRAAQGPPLLLNLADALAVVFAERQGNAVQPFNVLDVALTLRSLEELYSRSRE